MGVDSSIILFNAITTTSKTDQTLRDAFCAAMKALGEPQRLRIFTLLFAGERCVCDIEAAVRLPQNLVSYHLRSLREAGLVEARKDGRWMYYRINKMHLAKLQPAMADLFDVTLVSDAPAQC